MGFVFPPTLFPHPLSHSLYLTYSLLQFHQTSLHPIASSSHTSTHLLDGLSLILDREHFNITLLANHKPQLEGAIVQFILTISKYYN